MVMGETFESPLDSKTLKHLILNEINPEYSLKGLILKLKLQYFGHMTWRANFLEKTLMVGKNEKEEKGVTKNDIVGWYHWLNRHEFEQTLGDGEGQESLTCCSPWGHEKSDMTEQLNNNNIQKTKTMASDPITSCQIDGKTVETVSDFIFLGSKITADGDCSHEIKRRLLLGRKVMTNLDSILKSRDITLPTKIHLVKAMVFPVVMYGCELDCEEG